MVPSEETGGLLRVDVSGRTEGLWAVLRGKLIDAIVTTLDTVIDHKRGTTVRDEAREFSSALLEYARQRLARPEKENAEIEARIALLFSEREYNIERARSERARADAQELENAMRKLRVALSLTRAFLAGEEGEEVLFLGSKLDDLLKAIGEAERQA
ncbi:MAG: hypothetical protein EHM19_00735 [Candidatus Latescibacterota bacterium]|nr:MAG: hypothetical protein EHM19_00735 [Candidatus Latescibacterota bacterium]